MRFAGKRGKTFDARWLLLVAAALCSRIHFCHGRNAFDGADDRELSHANDEVMVRRVGVSSIPVSLWPLPKRSSHGLSHPISAYDLVWIPGGAVKILQKNIKVQR